MLMNMEKVKRKREVEENQGKQKLPIPQKQNDSILSLSDFIQSPFQNLQQTHIQPTKQQSNGKTDEDDFWRNIKLKEKEANKPNLQQKIQKFNYSIKSDNIYEKNDEDPFENAEKEDEDSNDENNYQNEYDDNDEKEEDDNEEYVDEVDEDDNNILLEKTMEKERLRQLRLLGFERNGSEIEGREDNDDLIEFDQDFEQDGKMKGNKIINKKKQLKTIMDKDGDGIASQQQSDKLQNILSLLTDEEEQADEEQDDEEQNENEYNQDEEEDEEEEEGNPFQPMTLDELNNQLSRMAAMSNNELAQNGFILDDDDQAAFVKEYEQNAEQRRKVLKFISQ
ncbi:MAG: hypothetical protein EZS28_039433 [Streblomastix strix]|uniref:Uncharacterized protein n=1 Tax=Streblomastix strix TaxID=222440 RepID=A0A5J4U4G7_9EUKA|nr:MAG: hypothetical protein EZS28_039433 [Streblomastix strix]